MTVAEAAREWASAGFSVVPVQANGSKCPVGKWKVRQTRAATPEMIARWYANGSSALGLGLVMGFNDAECLEFENPDVWVAYQEVAHATGLGDVLDRVTAGYSECSPGGGVHLIYRCKAVEGNTTLADDPANPVKPVLVETRGRGGFVVVAPSNGKVHPSGKPYELLAGGPQTVAEITADERADLFRLAKTLDRRPPKPPRPEPARHDVGGTRPGDNYNARASWAEVLEPEDWTGVYETDGVTHWRRPGKDIGTSATTNYGGSDLLYVFSTSTPFEAERSYDKFGAYAVLHHDGDHAAAAKELAGLGYHKGDGYSWNDAGNAERLIDRHGADMRWVPGYGGWHIWTETHWESDVTGLVTAWAKETARAITAEAKHLFKEDLKTAGRLLRFATGSANAGKITAMLKLAQAEPGISMLASAFDRDRNLLVCRNGTLRLDEGDATFREHRREDYDRRMAGAEYEPEGPTPRFDAFLAETVPDAAVRRYLQKLVGYSLIGGNPERRLIFVIGRTSTGKTTLLRLIDDALGAYAGTFDLTLFRSKPGEGPRADIVDVISKRLIYTTEANNEWRLHADLIKRLTGSDTIKARGLFSNQFVEKEPDFTPWIATNRAPTIEHADAALWRRLVAVPFDVQRDPAREDRNLRDRLATELPGVLAWAVEGAVAYLREGLLDPPVAVVEATMRLRESLSDLDAYLAERCESGAEYRVAFSDLYADYEMWCMDNRMKDADRLGGRKLADELEARGYHTARLRVGSRGGDRKVNFRLGLRLRRDDEDRSHRVHRETRREGS